MQEVHVDPLPLARLTALLSAERAAAMEASAMRARASFGDRVIWHVNATSRGGGVAEMLQTLLAYGLGAGVVNRWLVLDGDAEFLAITKRLHNFLHGDVGDGGALGELEHAHYRDVLGANAEGLLARVDGRDIVVLHDPQTAGLVDVLRDRGVCVAWRCHVGRDSPNALTTAGWDFLRPYVGGADAYVFSRAEYAPDWLDRGRMVVIPPSIDPFSAKNRDLDPATVRALLTEVGLVRGAPRGSPVHVSWSDGVDGVVRPRQGLLDAPPPPPDARLVVQVSRWDRLKDMPGVMAGFCRLDDRERGGAHLMLVGPDVSGVTDDPEGAAVLADCRRQWHALPGDLRARVHLASVPMDDITENAIIVNAVQRHAAVVVQKSLVEGFGLTVTEAMWKSRPVIASAVGGIRDQITDGRDGLLIADPTDPEALASCLRHVLGDQALCDRLGSAAHERVQQEFLGDRHLAQYVDLFAELVVTAPPAAAG